MAERLVLSLEEVPAVAGKVNVYVRGEEARVRVEFGAVQEPRFFERSLKGRPVTQVPWVMSRICGVCSVAHLTCSIEAIERALGLEPEPEVRLLREVAKGIEILQNNFVHVLMAIPDFTGLSNVVEFSKRYPKIFSEMISINKSVLGVSNRVCGRFIHMPSLGVAEHGKPISGSELEAAAKELEGVGQRMRDLAAELSELWRSPAEGFRDPAPTYCVLDAAGDEYPFFSERLRFSDGTVVEAGSYKEAIEELKSPYSNAHYTLYKGSPFYVGSRARLQAYARMLPPEVRELEGALRMDPANPFDNVAAQYIETAWLSEVLSGMLRELAPSIRKAAEFRALKDVPAASGEGVGLATAPRGVLIHHYRVVNGRLDYANIITPTVMNARHIEVSGEALIRWARERGLHDEWQLKGLVAALVRAYDPCLPCSVH